MSKLPHFPEFRLITLDDISLFQQRTHELREYADYNFVSLWSYNTEADVSISECNNNLVVRFRDYITNEPFYSFVGSHKIANTVDILLSHARIVGIENTIKLIPEPMIYLEPELAQQYNLYEDLGNHDYILSLEKTVALDGPTYQKKRNSIRKFSKNYPDAVIEVCELASLQSTTQLLDVFYIWEKNKTLTRDETNHELVAIQRLLQDRKHLNTLVLLIYDADLLIGFAITEKMTDVYALCHFVKANTAYRGIYDMIYWEVAKYFLQQGCTYLNRECDLGIEKLRNSKLAWHPVKFLKKYTISPK